MSKTELSTFLIFPLPVFPYCWMAAPSFQGLWPKILTPHVSHTHPMTSLSANSVGSLFNIHAGSHCASRLHCHRPQPSHRHLSAGLLKQPLLGSLCSALLPHSLLSTQAARKILLTHKLDQITFLLTSLLFPSHSVQKPKSSLTVAHKDLHDLPSSPPTVITPSPPLHSLGSSCTGLLTIP